MAKTGKRYLRLALLPFFLLAGHTSFAQTTEPQEPTTSTDTVTIQNLNNGDEQTDNQTDDMGFMPNQFVPEPILNVVHNITTVRALDKITAHITELELPQGEVVSFGTLRITARTCSSRPPEEEPETFAFLEIDDLQRDDELVRVFTGWMMASSPALNALEHSVYDIWVISC
ncbi:MAG: DUF2155 domain-containing protein, partial [Sphingomonadales bacterium]|nr:DUF2155 domain-containing protein [Sphingomonadales bacterium]